MKSPVTLSTEHTTLYQQEPIIIQECLPRERVITDTSSVASQVSPAMSREYNFNTQKGVCLSYEPSTIAWLTSASNTLPEAVNGMISILVNRGRSLHSIWIIPEPVSCTV